MTFPTCAGFLQFIDVRIDSKTAHVYRYFAFQEILLFFWYIVKNDFPEN